MEVFVFAFLKASFLQVCKEFWKNGPPYKTNGKKNACTRFKVLFLNHFKSRLYITQTRKSRTILSKKKCISFSLQLMFFHSLQVFGYSQCLMQLVGFGRSSYTQTMPNEPCLLGHLVYFSVKDHRLGVLALLSSSREKCAFLQHLEAVLVFIILKLFWIKVIVDMNMISNRFKSYKIHILQSEPKQMNLMAEKNNNHNSGTSYKWNQL